MVNEDDKPTEPNMPAAPRTAPLAGTVGDTAAHLSVSASLMNAGRAGYDGYARSTGRKTFDGRDMPAWEDLPSRIQNAWSDAAIAILALQAAQ